jgi:hypothetical protein
VVAAVGAGHEGTSRRLFETRMRFSVRSRSTRPREPFQSRRRLRECQSFWESHGVRRVDDLAMSSLILDYPARAATNVATSYTTTSRLASQARGDWGRALKP